MNQPGTSPEPASGAAARKTLDGLSAVQAADVLLWVLAQSEPGSLVIEPTRGRHAVRFETTTGSTLLATADCALGDAVVARLALIAALPIGSASSEVGRIKLSAAVGEPAIEVLLALRVTAQGLIAELHRFAREGSARDTLPGIPSTDPDEPGGTRVGPYLVMGRLGQGGMGVVYRAEHVALQKPVALKVLHPEVAANPAVAAQFIVEARAACRARHPGIVDVTDFGDLPDGRAYLVMELVEAPTLAGILAKASVLPAQRALLLARRMAEALAAASARGVVHRDLTPSNVFILENDEIKIGDFGLARIQGSSEAVNDERSEAIMGTAAYMAPEQGRGERVDSRSDIYALGCMMFRMLVGRIPFSGVSLVDVIAQHCFGEIPELVGPMGPLPDAVQRVVTRAMAKLPAERHQNFAELIADLETAEAALSRDDWRRWLTP